LLSSRLSLLWLLLPLIPRTLSPLFYPTTQGQAAPGYVPGVLLSSPGVVGVQSLYKAENNGWGGNGTSWRFEFKDDYKLERFAVEQHKADHPEEVWKELEVGHMGKSGQY